VQAAIAAIASRPVTAAATPSRARMLRRYRGGPRAPPREMRGDRGP
jgi:hypothetical protein